MAVVNHHNLHEKSTGMAHFEIVKPPKLPPYGLQCYAKITLFYPSRQSSSQKTKKGEEAAISQRKVPINQLTRL
jgi:hypothetical protein